MNSPPRTFSQLHKRLLHNTLNVTQKSQAIHLAGENKFSVTFVTENSCKKTNDISKYLSKDRKGNFPRPLDHLAKRDTDFKTVLFQNCET